MRVVITRVAGKSPATLTGSDVFSAEGCALVTDGPQRRRAQGVGLVRALLAAAADTCPRQLLRVLAGCLHSMLTHPAYRGVARQGVCEAVPALGQASERLGPQVSPHSFSAVHHVDSTSTWNRTRYGSLRCMCARLHGVAGPESGLGSSWTAGQLLLALLSLSRID
jgi:hypothetical protein